MRVFLTVLDSFGVGEAPDADRFGDCGANTFRSISESVKFHAPNLISAGLCNIDGIDFIQGTGTPCAAYGRMRELSMGKDTTTGHFEISGIISEKPFPTFPHGFPDSIISEFSRLTGRGVLCNKPYSGTDVIRDYGDEHIRTGKLIVYTSADSVFQIAAHEEVIPLEDLYGYCKTAREILVGDYAVGRVIARPFTGTSGNYSRTANRRDFSFAPPEKTVLDILKDSGHDVIAVGKIFDIFAGCGITEHIPTHSNAEGMRAMIDVAERNFDGLCFVNLVDFDMLYGHRRDIDGYAEAISCFDGFLPEFLGKMRDDILIITADHGCDPGYTRTTDHTREYVPVLVFGRGVRHVNLGTLTGFNSVAATVADIFGVRSPSGSSFYKEIRS